MEVGLCIETQKKEILVVQRTLMHNAYTSTLEQRITGKKQAWWILSLIDKACYTAADYSMVTESLSVAN
jgi:hypothetical protein